MFVCLYVCMFVCFYVFMFVCLYVCMFYVCMFLCFMFVCLYVCSVGLVGGFVLILSKTLLVFDNIILLNILCVTPYLSVSVFNFPLGVTHNSIV